VFSLKLPPIDILLALALSALAFLRPVRERIKNLPARGWLTVQGTIRGVTLSSQHGLVRSYLVHATYTYLLNGEYYSGFYDRTFLRKSSAEAFAANLKGQMAFVRYKPNVPARSALLEQDQHGWPS
jgi:Protein of unknown function (DUF3592)